MSDAKLNTQIENWMRSLGFHLEQKGDTPATLRKNEHWVSNDESDQPFYPHNLELDLAAFLYNAASSRDQQIALEARKPLERILDEQGWNRCEECNDFLPTNDECMCENCDSMFHEGCAGYVYKGDGEYPSERAYALCKSCAEPKSPEQSQTNQPKPDTIQAIVTESRERSVADKLEADDFLDRDNDMWDEVK